MRGRRPGVPGAKHRRDVGLDRDVGESDLVELGAVDVDVDHFGAVSYTHLAWCVKNPHVSTVITGASSAAQVRENMTALDAVPLLTKDVMDRIDLISLF